jgi:hypothetical protein
VLSVVMSAETSMWEASFILCTAVCPSRLRRELRPGPVRRRLSGVTDNSLYPVMFMSYLDVLVPGLKDSWQRT